MPLPLAIKCLSSIFVVVFALVNISLACEYEIEMDQTKFCISWQWMNAQKITRGKIKSSNTLSPAYIKKDTRGSQWLYSRAGIKVWEKKDPQQTPLYDVNLQIYPYMEMLSGHGHEGGSYNFRWDPKGNRYILKGMALHEMEGCWSLRWNSKNSDGSIVGGLLLAIEEYSNVSGKEKAQIMAYCSLCRFDGGGDHRHHP